MINLEPNLEPKEPKVAHQCSECGEPIYEGETALHLNTWGWVCWTCVKAQMEVVE